MPDRKSALVTGGSRGIGAEICRQLAGRGVRVAVNFRENAAAAAAVVQSLPGEGHAAFRADMADPDAVGRLWAEVRASFGSIDVVINNAAVYFDHPPATTGYPEWQKAWKQTLAANLSGPANLSLLAAQAMAAGGGGRIVAISSRGAFRGEPDAPAYGASKAGLNALSQSLARAFAASGVYFFCLAPGWVDTDMAALSLKGPKGEDILSQHPLGRVAGAEEVAKAAVFCSLDAPSAMTGCIIDVNGASYLRT